MEHHQIIRRPLITEKGIRNNEEHNTVVFQVDRRANKLQIKQALEALFQVKVVHVNTLNVQGKKETSADTRRQEARLEKGLCDFARRR